jgi:hypothetical protein
VGGRGGGDGGGKGRAGDLFEGTMRFTVTSNKKSTLLQLCQKFIQANKGSGRRWSRVSSLGQDPKP